MYHYERHHIDKATNEYNQALPFLREHIKHVKAEMKRGSPAIRQQLSDTFTYCKLVEVDNSFFSDALEARRAWDEQRFVDALDRYRRMAARGESLIESSKKVTDPAVERISMGNYIGTLANAAAAMAQLHMVKANKEMASEGGIVPFALAFDILRHSLQAYKYGLAAQDANPEWSQFRDALLAARRGIEDNLKANKANKNAWRHIYAQFKDEPEFLRIMASVDVDLFEEVERPRAGKKSRQQGTKRKGIRTIRILFLAANPTGTKRLYLDREARTIEERLQRSRGGTSFDISQSWAVRVTDLQHIILKHDPHVIHFSGHGSEQGEIILEDQRGRGHPVSKEALQGLFRAVSKGALRGVVLNSCFSATKARSIANHVEFVIGMSESIGDESAITFAASFYQALGYGKSVQTAFELGRNQIHLENLDDQDLPKLVTKKGLDPNQIVLTQ
jgi:hypothetical protein